MYGVWVMVSGSLDKTTMNQWKVYGVVSSGIGLVRYVVLFILLLVILLVLAMVLVISWWLGHC